VRLENGFKVKIRRKQHFLTISYPVVRYQVTSGNKTHGQGFFKTLFQIPNHEQSTQLISTY